MDLMRLVRSLEEFLYAVMTWLIFYPRTLWRIVSRPMETAGRVEAEVAKPPEEQFADLMSPPLFLVLSIFLVHLAELRLNEAPDLSALTPLATEMLGSDQLLLLFRAVIYSLFPLLMATGLLRRAGVAIDRDTLRKPFFVQCYFVTPLVIVEAAATLAARIDAHAYGIFSAILMVGVLVWYLSIQCLWFRGALGVSRLRALGIALKLVLAAALLGIALAAIVTVSHDPIEA